MSRRFAESRGQGQQCMLVGTFAVAPARWCWCWSWQRAQGGLGGGPRCLAWSQVPGRPRPVGMSGRAGPCRHRLQLPQLPQPPQGTPTMMPCRAPARCNILLPSSPPRLVDLSISETCDLGLPAAGHMDCPKLHARDRAAGMSPAHHFVTNHRPTHKRLFCTADASPWPWVVSLPCQPLSRILPKLSPSPPGLDPTSTSHRQTNTPRHVPHHALGFSRGPDPMPRPDQQTGIRGIKGIKRIRQADDVVQSRPHLLLCCPLLTRTLFYSRSSRYPTNYEFLRFKHGE